MNIVLKMYFDRNNLFLHILAILHLLIQKNTPLSMTEWGGLIDI